MKKKFDFALADDDDADLDIDLSKQINKIELREPTKKMKDAYSSVVSNVKENPYKAHREIDEEPHATTDTAHPSGGTNTTNQISTTTGSSMAPPPKQLSSAQIAAQKIRSQNEMELKVGLPAAGADGDDCEVYGGDYPEVDIDL